LTSGGKLSVRPMPKRRFHEIYQDYLCGCVLRIAREVFALLPLDTVLVTALAGSIDLSTGQTVDLPVLSVAMPRNALAFLDFSQVDPSDAMDNFRHRGDFKASRKSEAFQPIVPLTPADIPKSPSTHLGFQELLASIRSMREQIKTEIANFTEST